MSVNEVVQISVICHGMYANCSLNAQDGVERIQFSVCGGERWKDKQTDTEVKRVEMKGRSERKSEKHRHTDREGERETETRFQSASTERFFEW